MEKKFLSSPTENSEKEEGISFGVVLALALEYKWLVLCITFLFILLGAFVSFVMQPQYLASGSVQVEENASTALNGLKDLGSLMGLGGDTTVAAEQEILNSRMVLEKVFEHQKLYIVAEPKHFPVVGRAIASRYDGEGVSPPVLGMGRYAWGGERISVESLDVPFEKYDKKHILILGEGDRFEIYNTDDELVVSGKVGERVESNGYKVFISKILARPGTKFVLIKLSPDEHLEAFGKKYSIKELGKKSGILSVTLKGPDREKIGSVLADILNTYVRQNVERRSAEAENALRFLEKQLPEVKRQLDDAESAYNRYRQSRGSLDLTVETQGVLQSLVDVDNQIVALKQERDELRQYFTPEHPRLQAADARIQKLKNRRAEFEAQVVRLPATQQEVLRLARDVEVSTALYTDLVNTAQQLRVSKAGTVGDVRIIDPAAVTVQPVSIKPVGMILIFTVIGIMLSGTTVWVKQTLNVCVENPDEIEAALGIPVYAAIPHSSGESSIAKRATGVGNPEILAITKPDDDAVESLRSLRTTIHFALLDAKQNSLLVTGASPGLGKSFVSKNLGVVLAQTGKRVIIVDADLRRGHINAEFGFDRAGGISEYISGAVGFDEVVKPTFVPNLWIISTGQIPPNPSELLMHQRFDDLLKKLSAQFDIVIVDAPPILAVSDAAIIGRNVGATLMVARAGKHPIAELEQAVKRLGQSGVQVKGFVFNDFDVERQRYRYGYKGYVYKYSYKND